MRSAHVTGHTRHGARRRDSKTPGGRARQATNDVMDETDGVRGATAGNLYKNDRYVNGLDFDAGIR